MANEKPEIRSTRDYSAYQQQLQHENDNLNQKLVWHLISQSFFFGAYASLTNAPEKAKSILYESQQSLLLWVIPITALVIGIFTYPAILASVKYMSQLEQDFYGHPDPDSKHKPPIYGNPTLRRVSHTTVLALPLLLIATWLVILASQVRFL